MPHRIERILLGALFIVVCAIQIRWTFTTLDFVSDPWNTPQLALDVEPVHLTTDSVQDYAAKAGVKNGDTLLAIDGQPIRSFMNARRALISLQVGKLTVMKLRRGNAAPFEARFQVHGRHPDNWFERFVLPIALNIVTPWFGILLGFLVAFRRPGDPVAYAFLALLLCLSQFLKADGALRDNWSPIFTWPAYFIDFVASDGMPVSWLFFTLVFPDPRSRHKLLPKLSLALAIPFLLLGLESAVCTVASFYNPSAGNWFAVFRHIPGWLATLWMASLYTLGFANLLYKLRRETQPSTRRRLRWIAFGLSLGLAPLLLLILAASIVQKRLDDYPWWILMPCVLLPFFVPLTLAYAVLVDRVFDVGVFVRQGLLASKSVTVIRFVFIFGLIALLYRAVFGPGLTNVERWVEAIACLAGIAAVIRGADRLRRWVDRRFFLEAINTEHLLLELSDEVRRIADPQALLRVVTERVASALHVLRVSALIPVSGGFVPAFASGFDDGHRIVKLSDSHSVVARLREERLPMTLSTADSIELGAEVLLPLSTNGELHGILSLGPKRSDEPYSSRDLRLLESVASHTALALENGRLTAVVAAEAAHRERLNSELEIARDVQRRLFPKAAPHVPGLEIAGHCQPAQTIGGDYYDFLTTPTGETGLAIGDVAGKGIPAALLMAGLQASLRALTLAGISDLADLMGRLNQLVYDATPANRFATFFYGIYTPATQRLCYSSAGHNAVLLYRPATDEMIWLKTRGVGLGLGRNSKYEQADLQLQDGDCLVLYTDGVTEARNEEEDEFGEERLEAKVREYASLNAADMLRKLMDATFQFAGRAPQHDDITIIVARAVSQRSASNTEWANSRRAT